MQVKHRKTSLAGQRFERQIFIQVPGGERQDRLDLFQHVVIFLPYESNPGATPLA